MTTSLCLLVALTMPVTRTISEYGPEYDGRPMANGEIYRASNDKICATNDWKLGTKIKLIYKGKTYEFEVTDRMHERFTGKRIDLSPAGVKRIGGNPGGLTKGVEVVR